MKIKSIICSLVTVGLLAGGLAACSTDKGGGSSGAQISKDQATKIALDRVPGGTIKEAELEKEKGKLIWSFDIAIPGTKDITEVNVDAMTGAVINVSKETPADQAKEKKEDAKGKEDKD